MSAENRANRKDRLQALWEQLERTLLRDRFGFRKSLQQIQKADASHFESRVQKLSQQIERSISVVDRRRQNCPAPVFSSDLPVNERRDEIAELIQNHQVTIVCGETGSGKSTQLPKICLAAGRGALGRIGHTQPRRIAARSVAARIAEELKTSIGQTVGFKVRFHDQTVDQTMIKLMTDGILLAEIQQDRFLEEYDTIIIDEAHERSLNIDFLLAYLHSILPKRPDLKIIITSATIDAQRFSEHFSTPDRPAPIIEVSGRSYPVDIEYRPPDGERDQDLFDAINFSIQELLESESGDILIFLPTEKDIRTAAKKIRALPFLTRGGVKTDILPLYARLSAADQNRIFKPEKARRIVLATNVAESSLTVPRIKYVIDSGTARISRYSPRSKIQRLPIEAVSQASANQRAGRCGRLGPGVCHRLYSEEDFQSREPYTTPEIRRTNLASVILQVKAMRFGEIENLQFIDPPRPESIRDGYKTLFELGATDNHRKLTKTGHQLKHFPCDPRIARIILAGDAEGVLADVLIVAAALEVQDVRDRPTEKQKQADTAHEQFKNSDSDFLTMINIWDFYHRQKSKLSNSQLKRALQANFISFVRLREWLEVYRQLKDLCHQQKIKVGPRKNDYDGTHRAILTGILSGIATRGDKYEYQGAGGVSFFLWPGSGVMEQAPKWIFGSELVETTKRYLRNVARIQPAWIEPLSKHLVSRSYSDPHWHEKSEQVMAFEKVSLYGLVIVPRRRVPYGKIEPEICRSLFIEEGLVGMQMKRPFRFLQANQDVLHEAETMAAKTRNRDHIVESGVLFQFYQEKLPPQVLDGVSLHQWLKQDSTHEEILQITLADLLPNKQSPEAELYPTTLATPTLKLDLNYAFEPGRERDGVTTRVPAAGLSQLHASRLEWLVPGMVVDKIAGLIRSLPKSKRRALVPAPDTAEKVGQRLEFGKGDFLSTVADQLSQIAEEPILVEDFDLSKLDRHLRMNIAVVDDEGKVIDVDQDLIELQHKHGDAESAASSAPESTQWNAEHLTQWNFGDIPDSISVDHGSMSIPFYPGVADTGSDVSLRLYPTAELADQQTRRGLLRLATIAQKKKLKEQLRWLPDFESHVVTASQFSQSEEFRRDISHLLAKLAFVPDDRPVCKSESQFQQSMDDAIERISIATQDLSKWLPKFFQRYQELKLMMSNRKGQGIDEFLAILKKWLHALMSPRFLIDTPWKWLERFPAYFQSSIIRLEKISRANLSTEIAAEKPFEQWLSDYDQRKQQHQTRGIFDSELTEFRWMIEEMRVSQFSQQLGTLVPISAKRLEKKWKKVAL